MTHHYSRDGHGQFSHHLHFCMFCGVAMHEFVREIGDPLTDLFECENPQCSALIKLTSDHLGILVIPKWASRENIAIGL